MCSNPDVLQITRIITVLIMAIRIIVPIILIVVLSIRIFKGLYSSEINETSNIVRDATKKVIIAIAIFLVPSLVSFMMNIIAPGNEYRCFIKTTSQDLVVAKSNRAEELVKEAEIKLNSDSYNIALSYLDTIEDESLKESLSNRLSNVKDKLNSQNQEPNPGIIEDNPDDSGSSKEEEPQNNDNGTLKIYFISNKRKDAILIVGNDSVLFIDGGYSYDGKVALNFIKKLGIKKIDGLVGSHLDKDHVEAHQYIINNFDVGRVYYSVDPSTCLSNKRCEGGDEDPTKLANLIKSKNIPMTILTTGLNAKVENITFDIVGPLSIGTNNNYNSLNMILKFGNNKFYFSGDYIQEDLILNKYTSATLKVDVFKYPHHGENIVSEKFIDVIRPKYVMVPGFNKDRMKGKVNFDKFSAIGSQVLLYGNASTVGNVLIESDGNNIKVTQKFEP